MSQTPLRLSAAELASLRQFDSCKLANAIEKLNIRLHNEGYAQPGLRFISRTGDPIIGFAATSRVHCVDPPIKGAAFHNVAEWWEYLAKQPEPRIAVIEDMDPQPAQGAVLSDVHAEILRALGCRGVMTNGAARNLPALDAMDFPVFASQVTLSHAYVHLVAFGVAVEIHGLPINPGDLLYGDVHGVLSLPVERLSDILRLAEEDASREARVIDLCRSTAFSLERLVAEMHNLELTR